MTAQPSTSARLVELAVTDLGIIRELRLVLSRQMTALTGETGAGKTMIVGAIDLLLGGRADAALVRPGATQAVVEGRFDLGDEELVLTRVIPADGRSRAYVNGRMATVSTMTEVTGPLVDLHGQHAHQSLLDPAVQRRSLDSYGDIDLGDLSSARDDRRRLEAELADLGGDAGARAREADLLRYQLAEIDGASLDDPDEDESLDALEDLLAGAVAHQEAAGRATDLLTADRGVIDEVAAVVASLEARAPFANELQRLLDLQAELSDLAAEIRTKGEGIDNDPARLDEVRERRQLLVDLRRKYATAPRSDGSIGGGRLADVIAYRLDAQTALDHIEGHDARAAQLEAELESARQREAKAAKVVAARRRAVAPDLAREVEVHLSELAMPKARLEVEVGPTDPGDDVSFQLAANPGLPAGPLSKVASGGELARTMLALRLVVSGAPPILVFDEVDAGIGGDAAVAVGRSLARLGRDHQVLVVTHLAQVAASADHQVLISKQDDDDAVAMAATPLTGDSRVDEIARMLAGSDGGTSLRAAAADLLERSRPQGNP